MFARRLQILALGAGLAVSATLVAACGGDDSPDATGEIPSVGTSDSDSTSDDASGDVEAPTDRNEAFVLFDQCMHDKGFPTDAGSAEASSGPQVETGGGGGEDSGPRIVGPGGVEIDPDDAEAYEAAIEVCGAHLDNIEGDLDLSPEQQAAMEDAFVALEQCMQEKGFDNLNLSHGGDESGIVTEESDDDGDDPSSGVVDDPEAMAAAMEECSVVFDEYPELDDVPLPGRD